MSKAHKHWIFIREGTLIFHGQHTDPRGSRRSLEIEEYEISREEVKSDYPELLPEVDSVLAGKRAHTHLF